jgi:hypothetical protein
MAGGEGTQRDRVDRPTQEWEKRPIEDPLDQIEAAEDAEGAGRGVPQKSPNRGDDAPNEPWRNEPTDDELQDRDDR